MSNITLHTGHLYKQLKQDIAYSSTIYILSSFIMKSGVNLIWDDLQTAAERGADIKILTGDYLFVTQPEALISLLHLTDKYNQIEIRMWQSNGISFHPKTYIFKHKEEGALIVGSSNLSRSALTSGVEWNMRLIRQTNVNTFTKAIDSFVQLFYANQTMAMNLETLKQYKKQYDYFHRNHPDFIKEWTTQEEIELTLPTDETQEHNPSVVYEEGALLEKNIEPHLIQREALSALDETVSEEYRKAMVVMATGLGKTYLAAFFSKPYPRVLFIAHRKEILEQAKKTFEQILHKKGGFYDGVEKSSHTDLVFASIFTLSITDNLEQFNKDDFDLIIVDEFHHAAANSYKKALDYFKPAFLLGLTATPERTDGQDVFAICEGNVAYEISFIEAIRRNYLAPFKYYGIKDDIDYSSIRWQGNTYDQQQLLVEQINDQRANYILNKWLQLKQSRSIGFCSSIEQANYLASYFNKHGKQAIALTSQTTSHSRKEVIDMLETKQIDIIFTVDLFNEGVDIPSVDTLLIVRPTESLVVFTQQIGRGLRKYSSKDHCVIIDLIGNYRHADIKLEVFDSSDTENKERNIIPTIPSNCQLELETEVIDLLKELSKKRSPRKEKIYNDYLQIKRRLGKRPTYKEVHLYGSENSKEYRQAFGGYFAFLNYFNELTSEEATVYHDYFNWIQKVEKEKITKSYKMVILQFLLEKGPSDWRKPITPQEAAPYFHQFYMAKSYRKKADFSNANTKKLWKYNEAGIAQLIRKMPMEKWVGKDNLIYFEEDEFSLNFQIAEKDENILHDMTRQICEYKMQIYFERKNTFL